MRLRLTHYFIVAGFLFLCLTLVYNQLILADKYRQLSQANRIRILTQPARRGNILDRNGEALADNILSYNLLIMPHQGGYSAEKFAKLASIVSIPEGELISRYKKGYTAPFVPISLCEDISLSQAVAIGQLKYDFPELSVQANPKRGYPQGNIASHVLGYLGQIDVWRLEELKQYGYRIHDMVGYCGVEEIYDYVLHPQEGGMQIEVDSKGRLSRVIGYKAARRGRDIQLTIDSRIQKIIENNMLRYAGCAIALDPENGEILALASVPAFDPRIFQQGSSSLLEGLFNDPDSPLLNRAINGLYAPGSIFKVVVATAGLEKKQIDSDTRFFCAGGLKVGNRKFACWTTHGQEDVIDAIGHSCNTFFYNTGLRLGPQLINEYAQKFGLNQQTGIDLNGESAGALPYSLWQQIRKRQRWFAGDTANISIGQGGILVTPLQVTRMMAAVANGGKLIKPRLLKAVIGGDGVVSSQKAEFTKLPVSSQTLKLLKQGLSAAVNDPDGTANVLAGLKISIAGKTGTAQVASGQAHGWFLGFFPADKPKLVLCVFLEHAGTGYRSCLVAKSIISQMLEQGLL